MAQTLLATLALVLASLLSLNQQRNSADNYAAMVENEIEMAASGSLVHILDFVGSLSFDERSTPAAMHGRNYLPEYDDDFVAPSEFGPGDRGSEGCDLLEPFQTPQCNDVDDVHGLVDVPLLVELSNGAALPFTIDITVQYVRDSAAEIISSVPTHHKLVTVNAHSDYLSNSPISIRRVISYDPVKAELEYEEIYGPLEGSGTRWGGGGQGGGNCGQEFC